MGLFGSRRSASLGLDIGVDAIRTVRVAWRGNRPGIRGCARTRIDADRARALRALPAWAVFAEHVVSVSFSRLARLRFGLEETETEEQTRRAVLYRSLGYTGLEVDQVHFATRRLEPHDATQWRIVIAHAGRDACRPAIEEIAAAPGLRSLCAGVDSIALGDAWIATEPPRAEVALCNLGPWISVAVVSSDHLVFVSEFEAPANPASRIGEVLEMCEGFRGRVVDEVRLTGPRAGDAALHAALERELAMPVTPWAINRIDVDLPAAEAALWREASSEFAVACGLALLTPRSCANLLYEEPRER